VEQDATHMATVGIKGLRQSLHVAFVVFVLFMYAHTTDFCAISDLKNRMTHKNVSFWGSCVQTQTLHYLRNSAIL